MSSAANRDLTKREGVYYFKARIPAPYVEEYGRKIVSISLKTRDVVEARLRAGAHRRDLDLALKALGREQREISLGYTGPALNLTDADLEHICRAYRAFKLSQDELERIAGRHGEHSELEVDIYEDGVRKLRQAYARGDLHEVYQNLKEYLRVHGPRVLFGTPPFEKLARAFQLAEIEVYEAILQRRKGHAVDIPLSPTNGETYASVYKRWKMRKDDRPLKTIRAFEEAFETLRLHCTAISPDMLTKSDGINLRDKLIAAGVRSRATISKLIGFLHAAFECSVQDGTLALNPFKGIVVEQDKKAKRQKSRLPLPEEELDTLLKSRLFQPDFVPRKGLGISCVWAPLISLHIGARLEEICQLYAEDFRFDKKLSIWYVLIHEEGQRQVKNDNSIRQVPVHPELMRLGLVELAKKVKSGRLFPTLKPDKFEKLGTVFSTWFGRYLDELKIVSPQLVFHSLRHNFIQQCKQKATLIPTEVREAIVGHLSPSDIENQYGTPWYPLEPQIEAMKHIDFGIDFSRLYPVAIPA